MLTFFAAVALVGLSAAFTAGLVFGMALRSRKLYSDIARTRDKAAAAEHGIRLVVWQSGKSRQQIMHDYRFHGSELEEAS